MDSYISDALTGDGAAAIAEQANLLNAAEIMPRAATQAPSAGNQQPWEFYVITDRKKLEALSNVSPYLDISIHIRGKQQRNEDRGRGHGDGSHVPDCQGAGLRCQDRNLSARIVRRDETGKWAEVLGIPATKTCRAAVLIGVLEYSVDAVTHASSRKDINEVVVFVD